MADLVAMAATEPSPGFGVAAEPGAMAWLGRSGDAVIAVLAEGADAMAVVAAMRASIERGATTGTASLLAAWADGVAAAPSSRASVIALWLGPNGGVAVHAGDVHLHAVDGEREPPRRLLRPHTTIGPALRHLRRVRTRAMGLGGRAGEPEIVELDLRAARRVVASTASVWMPLAEQVGVEGAAVGAASALLDRAQAARDATPLARAVAEVPRACVVIDLSQLARPAAPVVAELTGGETTPAPVVVAAQRDARRAVRAAISRLVGPRGALIVGERGSGKSAVIAALVPERRDDGKPAYVEIPALTLGRALRGGGAPASLADGRVLVVDRLADALAEAGAGAAALAGAVARGELQLVGCATPAERAALARTHAALYDELAIIELGAPTADEVAAIVRSWSPRFARRHRVRIDPVAADAAATLSARFPLGRAQPEAALFALEQACLRAGHAGILTGNRTTRGGTGGVVDRAAVISAIADHARLPAELVEGDDVARAARFEQLLAARIAGQPRAVSAVAGALARAIEARGGAASRKPLASLLLLGPTGTGKTETARLFAEGWFLDPKALFAVDLSEYQDKESVHRLIGAPPGYLGHGDRTPLAIAMAERPRRVVLFDEIEKAHRDVLDVLLQLLDEGRLTTGQGESIRFDEAVVILTSNLAIGGKPAARAGFAAGSSEATMDEPELRVAVGKELRPELVGRLDALVRFEPIDRTTAQAIALAHLRRLTDALITTGRLAPARLPALRKDVIARLGAREGKAWTGGAREVMRLVEDVVRDERASAPPPHSVQVVYPWHDGGREVSASGVIADLEAGVDPNAAADLVLVHPAGASLLYVAQIGARLVALLGDDDAAFAIATALTDARLVRQTAVARGRVRGDVAGRPIGELVDRLLS